MLHILMMIAGITAGIFMGGRVKNLLHIRLEKVWLIIPAFILQVLSQMIAAKGVVFSTAGSLLVQGLSYSLLLLMFWFNRHYVGMAVIGAGCFLNAAVIMLNGGRMPVGMEAVEKAGYMQGLEALKAGLDAKHTVLDAGTRLAFLADVIHIPGFPGIWIRVASIGDVVIAIGLAILVFELTSGRMRGRYSE